VPVVHPGPLFELVETMFRCAGSEPEEAAAIARQLVGANLAGHDSHGVGLIPPYLDFVDQGLVRQNGHIRIARDLGALSVIEGGTGFGAVIGDEAMRHGIARAGDHGVAVLAIRNSFHLGRIGHWAEQCARAGMASIHLVNVAGHPPLVSPYGGIDGRFGTNPICIAIPGGEDGEPLAMVDMATSTVALGKLRVVLDEGAEAPAGALIDSEGDPTRDPAVMFTEPMGSLLPMGLHKGSGLAIMIEALGALTGGITMQPGNPRTGSVINNMISIVIDPEAVRSTDHLLIEARAFLDYVKTSRPAGGVDEVLLPGEPERRMRAERSANGFEIAPATWAMIFDTAKRVGVDVGVLHAVAE
jgi:uncharacterized oxidoreductase